MAFCLLLPYLRKGPFVVRKSEQDKRRVPNGLCNERIFALLLLTLGLDEQYEQFITPTVPVKSSNHHTLYGRIRNLDKGTALMHYLGTIYGIS